MHLVSVINHLSPTHRDESHGDGNAAWKVHFETVTGPVLGVQIPPSPTGLCQPNWSLPCQILRSLVPGPPQMAPQGSARQEDVTEAQEGKTTLSRPLRETLCAAGFGSAPALTSSGGGTQMYSSLVLCLSENLKKWTLVDGRYKLMLGTIRKDKEKSDVRLRHGGSV